MKKLKNILVAVLLLVITLNINYLGMIDTKIVVTSKEYKEGNTDNLVLNKILSDNELKTEIPHMFNYTSNGLTYGNSVVNEKYVTSGLYYSTDEDGTTYYYRGNIDNNYIQFGEYQEDYYVYRYDSYSSIVDYDDYVSLEACKYADSKCDESNRILKYKKGTPMYFRIVRVNGDGTLRLIYSGVSLDATLQDLTIGGGDYEGDLYGEKYAGYTYDRDTNEMNSNAKRDVDTWYNNALKGSVYENWIIDGRYCSDSSGYEIINSTGYNYYASRTRLNGYLLGFSDNNPTFSCPNTDKNYGGAYRLKVGLITADELVYSGILSIDNYNFLESDSYLKNQWDIWTMTPYGASDNDATVWNSSEYLDNTQYISSSPFGFRPVINVSTENMTLTGDGTIDNPYMLEEVEPTNSYKGKVTIEVGTNVEDVTAFEEKVDLSNVSWTVKDESIVKIENGKIVGLKNGTTVITGVDDNGNTYEIEVNVISNPTTNSALYLGIGISLILIISTGLYMFYRKVVKISE